MPTHLQPEPILTDARGVAARLGIGVTKARELIAAGDIPSVLIGRRRLSPIDGVDEYARRLVAGG